MADSFHLELVTPSSLYFSGEATMVVIPGAEGDFGVLPNHAPLISQIRPGIVSITKENGQEEKLFIRGGYTDVTPSCCTILAQEILQLSDISAELIESRTEEAKKSLRRAQSEVVKQKAETELEVLAVMDTLRKAA